MDTPMEEKLQHLLSAIECPSETISLFHEVICLLEGELRKKYRKDDINVYGFGSIVTGLLLKNCDLDIFVTFEPPDEQDKRLRLIRNTLHSFGDMFSNIIIIQAKVPIVRSFHEMGFGCDISVGNIVALENSRLIKFYISMNESFHLFFMCVKLWMMRHNLCGSRKFTSYATGVLCIFFLQQKKLVPSVFDLQNNSKSPKPRLIDGWNISFLSDKDELGLNNDKLSVLQLLSDFFSFYATFDFGFYVMSPFTGCLILKPLPDYENNQPSGSPKFDNSKALCLQDPFTLDFNPCRNVSQATLIYFQTYCQHAHQLCVKENESPQKNFLKELFSPYVYYTKRRRATNCGNLITISCGRIFRFGDCLEESRKLWLSEQLEILEKIFLRIVVAKVERTENSFKCELHHQILKRNPRKKVAASANINLNLPIAQRAEAISTAYLKKLPATGDLKPPVIITINHCLLTSPTRLQLDIVLDSDDPQGSEYFHNGFLPAVHKDLALWVEDCLNAKYTSGASENLE